MVEDDGQCTLDRVVLVTVPHVILLSSASIKRSVLVDDKLRILTAVKKIWDARGTIIFPRQDHYAFSTS